MTFFLLGCMQDATNPAMVVFFLLGSEDLTSAK